MFGGFFYVIILSQYFVIINIIIIIFLFLTIIIRLEIRIFRHLFLNTERFDESNKFEYL